MPAESLGGEKGERKEREGGENALKVLASQLESIITIFMQVNLSPLYQDEKPTTFETTSLSLCSSHHRTVIYASQQ